MKSLMTALPYVMTGRRWRHITKALNTISEEEMLNIQAKWVPSIKPQQTYTDLEIVAA